MFWNKAHKADEKSTLTNNAGIHLQSPADATRRAASLMDWPLLQLELYYILL